MPLLYFSEYLSNKINLRLVKVKILSSLLGSLPVGNLFKVQKHYASVGDGCRKSTACITCSGAPLYIYQIMGLSVLHAHAKERLPEDVQHGVAKTPYFLDLHLLWSRIQLTGRKLDVYVHMHTARGARVIVNTC